MNPTQSLYDFTLNLLNDPSARDSFGSDPQRTLNDAGLGDISGADLHEILPLVLDYAPTNTVGGGNGLDLDSITTGQAGAIEQLKALTQNLSLGDATSENNVLGAVGGMTAITQNAAAPFTAAGDLAGSIDDIGGGEIAPVGAVTGAVGDVAGNVSGGDVTGALEGGNLTSGLQDVSGLDSAIDGSQGVGSTVGDLTGTLGVNNGLENTLGDVTAHGVGDIAGQVSGVTSHLSDVANDSAVGNVTNHVGDVTNHVGDIGSHAGSVNDVHDVVSDVGNGALGGGIAADLSHLTVGSGNDLHITD
ncbi:IniB N-terminal domain-containing protein [Amycolatopsis sp. lyj-84]|uniref:IniB N-terminal domain-containing protein n=1 Tax=Amycolatopsis sp. lyj-84 TaxID=2789284 RepID=UPI00397E47F5